MNMDREAFGRHLSACEREPIHTPDAIQPHGALVAALADTLLVTHASANLLEILGRPAQSVLGRPLAETLGGPDWAEWLAKPSGDGYALIGPNGKRVGLRAHRSGPYICIDIEPYPPDTEQRPLIALAQSALNTFKHTTTRRSLCELAVTGLRAITGYDRVVAYRFHDDGHGEVIAEARAGRVEPYLGLHYPAGDVPPQARRLYLRQRICGIADSSYQPVPLLTDPALDNPAPLDLTHSTLRSASPVHRQYMRNMKVAASLSIGLAIGSPADAPNRDAPNRDSPNPNAPTPDTQELWGMLVCHHLTPRVAVPEVRAVAEMIGQVVSLLLSSLGETEIYAERFKRETNLRAIVDGLAEPVPLATALEEVWTHLLDLVAASGVVISIAGVQVNIGRTPSPAAIELALPILRFAAGGNLLAVDDLALRYPELAECAAYGSGALLMPFARDPGSAILWFRPEVARTIDWGGNPDEYATIDAATGRLSPRSSFAAWRQTVRGRSAPWAEIDLALARELRDEIEAAIAQRTEAALARLRHYDPLTGLPNRSFLQDCLKEAVGETHAPVALLFLDLDRFKSVNDTMGHTAGDALLTEVAQRLLTAAGPDDMPARIGGDEFVVLCKGRDREAACILADRIRVAIEAPFEIAGRTCHISASIGIATLENAGGTDLLRAADTAMYEAKRTGGNREVVYDPSLFDQATRMFELEQDMHVALRQGDQFTLLYQPMFRIDAGRRILTGIEALIRWRHPRHGWMSPLQFIPLAEKSGLMPPLGDWVFATALREGLALQKSRPDLALQLSVNVSASQILREGFRTELAALLEAEGFPPALLCLEVTDGILTDTAAMPVLAAVRKLGVHVAIDDFGVGYSSLSYLRRLPADIVKLDRDFLLEVDGDIGGGRFVGAVVALAHAAGMQVVFERIDTQTHLDVALAAGADMVQGFLLAPPLSASAVDDFVLQHRQTDDRRTVGTPLSD